VTPQAISACLIGFVATGVLSRILVRPPMVVSLAAWGSGMFVAMAATLLDPSGAPVSIVVASVGLWLSSLGLAGVCVRP